MSERGSCRALFLDRDGVLNRERGQHTWRLEDFEVLPDVADVLRQAAAQGYLLVVITNQSGVGLGLYGISEVNVVHDHLVAHLAAEGVFLADILFCPHHPSKGRCLCRKPGSLLLERAIARHGIDPQGSLMVGDRERDMEAAAGAGVRGVLMEPNGSLRLALKNELRTR